MNLLTNEIIKSEKPMKYWIILIMGFNIIVSLWLLFTIRGIDIKLATDLFNSSGLFLPVYGILEFLFGGLLPFLFFQRKKNKKYTILSFINLAAPFLFLGLFIVIMGSWTA